MKGNDITALDEFVQVFGEDHGTAQVLTTPSQNDGRLAMAALEDTPVHPIVRDLAIVCAREVGNVLEQSGLRPADYAEVPDLPQVVLKLVKNAMGKGDLFEMKFREYLRMRG
jgi:hypothetical protein